MTKVSIIMGSQSDWEVMQHSAQTLQDLHIPHESRIISAHRTPQRLYDFCKNIKDIEVIIAGASMAAHLPGMTAALTHIPVIGVPGNDCAISSILQMPTGIPVGTMAVGKVGAINAALFAAAILSIKYEEVRDNLIKYREKQTNSVPEYPK